MGYNNNYAGMHMIWYGIGKSYDDLDYYDKLAEKNRKNRVFTMNIHDTVTEENEKIVEKKENKSKKKKNKNQREDQFEIKEYIDGKQFANYDIITRNAAFYALKKKKDISYMVYELEAIMRYDKGMIRNRILPMLEKGMIFLSVLAEKLECSIYDLLRNTDEERKEYIYDLLDKIEDDEWNVIYIDEGNNEVELSLGCYFVHNDRKVYEENNIFLDDTDLIIKKVLDGDKYIYGICYGNLVVRDDIYDTYLGRGAWLLVEEDGKIKEVLERIIKNKA